MVEGTVIFVDDVGVEIDLIANFYQGSIVIVYVAQTKTPVLDDITVDFVNEVGVVSGDTIEVSAEVTILKGQMSGQTIVTIDDNYERLSDDYVIKEAAYKSNTKMSVKRTDIVAYEAPVKSTTADIPGTIVEDLTNYEDTTETTTSTPEDNTPEDNTPSNPLEQFRVYHGKLNKMGVEESDIDNLTLKLTTQIVNSHIELPESNGYGFILVPTSMSQPSMFRDSVEGCVGFAIPMIDQGTMDVGEIGSEISYKMYRTYVPTWAKVDIWLCE